jgi:hypothetical protein
VEQRKSFPPWAHFDCPYRLNRARPLSSLEHNRFLAAED